MEVQLCKWKSWSSFITNKPDIFWGFLSRVFFLCLRTLLGKEGLHSHSCIQSLHMRELIVNSLYMPLVFASLTFKKGVIEVFPPNPGFPSQPNLVARTYHKGVELCDTLNHREYKLKKCNLEHVCKSCQSAEHPIKTVRNIDVSLSPDQQDSRFCMFTIICSQYLYLWVIKS